MTSNCQIRRFLAIVLFMAVGTVHANEPEMLIFCGITMVRPITELARQFEQTEKVRITITQGGSEDMYQSAKRSRQGDIYFPGEPAYRDRHLAEGLLGYYRGVGYNQAAFVVPKGNPKQVKPAIKELMRKDLTVIVGNVESGSIGQETKRILDSANLYPKVVAKAALMMPDSRAINLAMRRGEGEVAINWRATAFFPDNLPYLDVVDLDPKVATPQALLLIQLTFSKNPALSKKFIDFVASPEGQVVFRKYGFLDNSAF